MCGEHCHSGQGNAGSVLVGSQAPAPKEPPLPALQLTALQAAVGAGGNGQDVSNGPLVAASLAATLTPVSADQPGNMRSRKEGCTAAARSRNSCT